MRVLVQHTRAHPQGWEPLDVVAAPAAQQAWRRMPTKPEPSGGERVDNQPGWVWAVCVQGMTLSAGHYAVWPQDDAVAVAVWNDAPPDTPAGEAHGWVWTFHPPGPDVRFGGRVNTRQTVEVYAEAGAVGRWVPEVVETTGGRAEVRPWAEFPKPASALVRHGISVPGVLARLHRDPTRPVSWREWVG